ncbi:MAG: translation initiation factor [Synergistaceae bacterium]
MAREQKNKKATQGNGYTLGSDTQLSASLASILGKPENKKPTETTQTTQKPQKTNTAQPQELKIPKVTLQKKTAGCGGKTVTVITISKESNCKIETLAKEIKKALGCGARTEEGKIILQGDIKERAAEWFSKKGTKQIVIG